MRRATRECHIGAVAIYLLDDDQCVIGGDADSLLPALLDLPSDIGLEVCKVARASLPGPEKYAKFADIAARMNRRSLRVIDGGRA